MAFTLKRTVKRFFQTTSKRYMEHYNDFYEVRNDSQRIDLVLLNTPIINTPLFRNIFNRANRVICADGGANRLYQTSLT
jgi:hypothetical protein